MRQRRGDELIGKGSGIGGDFHGSGYGQGEKSQDDGLPYHFYGGQADERGTGRGRLVPIELYLDTTDE